MSASDTGEERVVYEKVRARQEELTGELRAGQEMLAELDAKRAELQQTLLRISGAVQVLTELLDENGTEAGSGLPGHTTVEPQAPGPSIAEFKDVGVVSPDGSLSAAR